MPTAVSLQPYLQVVGNPSFTRLGKGCPSSHSQTAAPLHTFQKPTTDGDAFDGNIMSGAWC